MNKTVLITGGSGGIGTACAQLLTSHGARVILVGRRPEALRRAAQELPADRALCVQADVTQSEDVDRMMAEALAWSPRIDILLNNAGAAYTGRVESFPVDEWHRLVNTNLTSVFLCCRAILPVMKRQGDGLIVNLASAAGKEAFPGWGPYCATKFGLVGLSRALHEEVRAEGIRVTLLYPGGVDTPLWDTAPNTFEREKMLRVSDVARAVLYVVQQPAHIVVDELSLIYAGGAQ